MLGSVSLLVLQVVVAPPLWLGLGAAIGASLVLLRMHRDALDIVSSFPELRRVPLLARFLHVPVRP
ncbi:MAG: hypothetical protein M3545_16590 [Acidobacteriota bacterium]|nr:hypothetical protein [Acidobacteriota bacterium]